MEESAFVGLGVADERGDVVGGGEEGIGEGFGAGEGQVGDTSAAEGDLLEV